jgi:hypothetical protein
MASAARLPHDEPIPAPTVQSTATATPEQLPLRLLMLVEKIDRSQTSISAELKHIRENLPQQRRPLSRRTQEIHIRVTWARRAGFCPCCQSTPVCTELGRLDGAEWDHWYSRNLARVNQTWLVCRECNQRLVDSDFKSSMRSAFEAYQAAIRPFLSRQMPLGLVG